MPHSTIDLEDAAGDVTGLGESEETDGGGHVLDLPHPAEGDGGEGRRENLVAERRLHVLSTNPGATALTVMTREPTSRHRLLVSPMSPALAA